MRQSTVKTKRPAHSRGLRAELASQLGYYGRLMRLDRPIGIWLLLWPTLWALWISSDGTPDPWVFTVFVLGALVMRSAGCVINDFVDRKLDQKVSRTSNRPLVQGTVAPVEAIVLFVALCLIALGLVMTLDRLTQTLALAAVMLTVLYPFCKRFFAAPQLILGVAFAWAVPMAFAAHTGTVPRLAWLLGLAVVVWAIAYDTMYAMADRADDLKAGIRSTAIMFGQADVFVIAVLQALFLFALLLVGEVADLGMWYRLSLLISALFMVYQFALIRNRDPDDCFKAFLNNRHIGATVFVGIALSYIFQPPV